MSRLLLLPTTTTGGGGRATGKRPSAARLSRIVTSSATDPVQICTQAAKLAERVQQRIEPIFADTYLAQSDVLPVQVRDDWRLLQREAVTIAFSAIKGNLSACRGTVSVLINDPLSEQGDEVVELGKDDAEVITEEKDAGIRDRIVEIEQQTVGMVDELQKLCRKIRPSVDLLVELSQAQQTNLGELRIVISCMKAKDVPIIDAAVREIMHVKKDESFQSLESVRFLAKYCSSDLRIKYEKEHLNYVLRSDKPWLIYSLYRGLLTRSANPLLTALKYHLVFLEIKRNTGNEEYGRFANSFVSYAHEMLDSCGSPQVALYLMTKTCKKDPTSRKTSSGKPDTISEESKNDKKKGTNRIKSLLGFSEIQKKFSSDGNLEDEFRVSALDYALEKNVAMFFHNPLVQKIFDELWVSSDFMGSTKAQSESSVKDSLKIGSIAARWEDILRFMKNLQTYLVNYLAVPRQKYFFRFASFFFIICALYLHLITLDPTTELSFNFLDLFLIVSAASLVTQQIRDIQEEGMYYHFKSSENLFDLLLTACLVSFLIIRLFFSVTFVDTDSITLALYLFFGCLVSIAASFRLIQGLKVLRDFGPLSK
jgi:pyrimidine operon attenuation protein/uracil phosphoribosyltransferase